MRTVCCASSTAARPGYLSTTNTVEATCWPVVPAGTDHSARVVAWQNRQDASCAVSCLWMGAQKEATKSRLKQIKAQKRIAL